MRSRVTAAPYILVSHDRALLRALTTRVWVLHERRITDFPGGFEEWETASSERAHAARVAAAEDEALRRVHERKQTRRSNDGRKQQQSGRRTAERKLAERKRRSPQVRHAWRRSGRGWRTRPSMRPRRDAARPSRWARSWRWPGELERAFAEWEAATSALENA